MDIKKVIKIIITIIILIIIALIILYFIKSKNYAKTDETIDLRERVSQELYFLDDYIFSIANSVNNINLENYIVKSETIIGQSSKEDNNSDSSSSEKSGNETSDSGNSSSKTSDSDSDNLNKNDNSASSYILEPSDVLVNDRIPDWESIKIAVERLYTTWSTIIVDLYKLNVDKTLVQNFSRDLDELAKSAKAEDKNNTLIYASKLYHHLIDFGKTAFTNILDINMISTKSEILNAYSLIEQQNWDEIKANLQKAEEEYIKIMNNEHNKNKYNINKAYIMLKEFQSSINSMEPDILYIKYKNLLDELNVIGL